MNDATFYILDVSCRDEIVVNENDEMKELAYESGDDSDLEMTSKRKNFHEATGKESIVIHLFGSMANGKSIRVDCKGFEPFFYVRIPEIKQDKCLDILENYVGKCLKDTAKQLTLTLVKRKLMYGYTGGELFSFVEIRAPSMKLFRNVKNLFLNDKSEPKTKWSLGFPFSGPPKIYEANLDPYLRFLHLRNLKPCDWAVVKDGMSLLEETENGLVIEDCDWLDINPCTSPPQPTAPCKVASWDIECWSSTGDFPVPSKDPVIQIGTIISKLGSKETEKYIFVLGTCDPVPGAKTFSFKTEKELLLAWFRWVVEEDINILIGYNVFGFDEKYVWERCKVMKIYEEDCIQKMNRLCDYGGIMRLDEKRLSSSAMGDNFLYLWNTTGRLRIDLYHAIKRQYPMGSYKLDDVSRAFLNDPVTSCTSGTTWTIEVDANGISKQNPEPGRSLVLLNENGDSLSDKCIIHSVTNTTIRIEAPIDVDEAEVVKWAVVKDDLSPQEMFKKHCGSSADRALIGAYCVQDCQLVLDLFRKLDTFNNAASMANVCSVPIAHIFLRGQGIKIESLIFKYCYHNQICIEVLPSPGFGKSTDAPLESYEGAIVLDPISGFYKVPVGVADFASLYPSTIISENISHDTLVWVKDYDSEGKLVKVYWGAEFAKYDTPTTVPFTDIEYDIIVTKEGDTRKNPEKVKDGIRVCRYAQDKQGAIPIIIAQLLDARKKTRALIKTEKDPFKQSLLDSQQNAYKITANSLYGQLGSGTFKIRLQALAASVTAYGRKQIMFAKSAIETFYGPTSGNPLCNGEVIYGDTDSLFVCFNPKKADGTPLEGKEALVETIRLTEEAGKLITQGLKSPHDFEFDKVYWPFLIFSKKRYVGHKYETADHYTQTSMGIALKRRDYAPIAKKIYGGAIHILLTEKNVAKAAEFVKTSCKELIEGKYGLGPLTITKSLRSEYANPLSVAHKVLADRIGVRSPGEKPASGDRIAYVYIQPPTGQSAADLQGDRIETPAFIKENRLKPDYMFYIDHQISNPVCQVFGLLIEEIPGYTEQAWDMNPDKAVSQRENMAYKLLFQDAIHTNTSIAKKSFMSLMGVDVHAAGTANVRMVRSPTTVTKKPVKQSSLDKFFVDKMILTAKQEVKKKQTE
jgi:DNA polymerase elongation subunit (family B)